MIHFTGLLAKAWENPTDVSNGAEPATRKQIEMRCRETLMAGGKVQILMSLDTDVSRTYRRWHCSASWPGRDRNLEPEMAEPLLVLCHKELGSAGKQDDAPIRIDGSKVSLMKALGLAAQTIERNPDASIELVTARAVHVLRPLSLDEHVELTARTAASR